MQLCKMRLGHHNASHKLKAHRRNNGVGAMRLAAGLLAIASLIAVVDGQMNLYDPNDDALDHVQPNKPHADALRQLRRSLPSDPHGMMRWWDEWPLWVAG